MLIIPPSRAHRHLRGSQYSFEKKRRLLNNIRFWKTNQIDDMGRGCNIFEFDRDCVKQLEGLGRKEFKLVDEPHSPTASWALAISHLCRVESTYWRGWRQFEALRLLQHISFDSLSLCPVAVSFHSFAHPDNYVHIQVFNASPHVVTSLLKPIIRENLD